MGFKNEHTRKPPVIARPRGPVTIVENTMRRAEAEVETYVVPVRKSLLKRFPLLFSFLVTFGVIATFLGIEQMLLQYAVLQNYPFVIFLIGVVTLIFTGRLYKKLR